MSEQHHPMTEVTNAAAHAVAVGTLYRRTVVIVALIVAAAMVGTLATALVVVTKVGHLAGTNRSTLQLLLNEQSQSGNALKQFTDREDAVARNDETARRRDLRVVCAYLNGGRPCVGLHFPKRPPPPPPLNISPAPTTRPHPTPRGGSRSSESAPATGHPRPSQSPRPSPSARSPTPSPTPHPTPTPTTHPTPSPPPLACVVIRHRKVCTPPIITSPHTLMIFIAYMLERSL